MPHSKNRNRNIPLGLGVNRCPCSQIFKNRIERDFKVKLRMHLKVCPDPPEGMSKFEVSRKCTIV